MPGKIQGSLFLSFKEKKAFSEADEHRHGYVGRSACGPGYCVQQQLSLCAASFFCFFFFSKLFYLTNGKAGSSRARIALRVLASRELLALFGGADLREGVRRDKKKEKVTQPTNSSERDGNVPAFRHFPGSSGEQFRVRCMCRDG